MQVSFLMLLLAAPSVAWAQVRPGFELGVNVSSLSYDDDGRFPLTNWSRSRGTSLTGGVTLEMPLRERFALVTGFRYVQAGTRVEFDYGPAPGETGSFRLRQHYLGVPVRTIWRPSSSRGLFISLGPEIALLLSGQTVLEYSSPTIRTDTVDITDDLNRITLMLDAEAGVEFPLYGQVGVVTLRYTHGLTGAAKEDNWASGWKTRGIELLLGAKR